ncbi:MAG: hypothetical protein H3Z53_01915 [archaeon]|nr:hypothetical protein [archaeon]
MSKKVALGEEKILDSWSILIEKAQDKSEEFYNSVMKLVEEEKMPNVKAEMVAAYPPGGFKLLSAISESARAKGRNYLMISNDYLDHYRFFVGAKDYGKNLNVSWYLVCETHFLDALFKKPHEKIVYTPVYLFDQEELTAYVTCAHHCVLKAVENIMLNLGQDPSKIDRKSKGFLGVS